MAVEPSESDLQEAHRQLSLLADAWEAEEGRVPEWLTQTLEIVQEYDND